MSRNHNHAHVKPACTLSVPVVVTFCVRHSVVELKHQSFQFLVDVSEFHKSIRTQDGKDDFEEFLAIVNDYIKDGSNFEINIDHRTKKDILKFSERSAYISLNTVSALGCSPEMCVIGVVGFEGFPLSSNHSI